MAQEIMTNEIGVQLTAFQFAQEELGMELVDLLNVAKNNIALATQNLWYILTEKFWNVIFNDVLQRMDIVSFRLNHFTHYQ